MSFVRSLENRVLDGHRTLTLALSRKRARVRKRTDLVLFGSKIPSPIPMGEGEVSLFVIERKIMNHFVVRMDSREVRS